MHCFPWAFNNKRVLEGDSTGTAIFTRKERWVHWTILTSCHLPRIFKFFRPFLYTKWWHALLCIELYLTAATCQECTRENLLKTICSELYLTSAGLIVQWTTFDLPYSHNQVPERKNYIWPAPRRALSVERSDGWTEEKHVVEKVLDSSSLILKMLEKTKDKRERKKIRR